MRQLLPDQVADLSDDALADLYDYPAESASRAVVRANFVSTLDGSATGADGRSGSINSEADKRVFGLMRALCDVVLVGAGTARAEGYRPIRPREVWTGVRRRRGLREAPALALVTRSLRLPDAVLEAADGAGQVLVVTSDDAPAWHADALAERLGEDSVVRAGGFAGDPGAVDPQRAVAALAERGLRRVLCEGGPSLMGDVLAAGRLDELCLTWSPLLVGGDGPRIALGGAVTQPMRCAHLLEQDGVLVGRWVRV